MVLSKKHLIVFGGYNDNGIDYKYYNDVHLFDLENRTWRKIDPAGKGFLLMRLFPFLAFFHLCFYYNF